jgi:hypothetical protein
VEVAMDGEKLREGIFALRTRRVGSVAECMIMRLLNYSKGRSLFHDLYDDKLNHRIEVKFSIVQKKAETTVTIDTVLRCIEEAVAENRSVAFSEWKGHKFDCNIQQVKRAEFDVLYYGLFFWDCIKIFRIECREIRENSKGGRIYYSDLQHKGNIGEGQFHIKTENLQTPLIITITRPFLTMSYMSFWQQVVRTVKINEWLICFHAARMTRRVYGKKTLKHRSSRLWLYGAHPFQRVPASRTFL